MLNGARGYPFESKYVGQEGVDIAHFWKMYDMFYSVNSKEAEEALNLIQALPYQEDIEAFKSFKADADATPGTLGHNAAMLDRLSVEHAATQARIKEVEAQEQAIDEKLTQNYTTQFKEMTKPQPSASKTTPANTATQNTTNKRGGCTLF